MTDDTIALSKPCARCNDPKPYSEFYLRRGFDGTQPGHYLSECKACMRERSKTAKHLPKTEPRAFTEQYAIHALRQNGIHALPGKAVAAADVDVVAWGGVWIEVKYSRLTHTHGHLMYFFTASKTQVMRGYLAHILMLICEDEAGDKSYHLFPVDHPVFYINGHLKVGFTFRPGAMRALKHGENRVVMTQPLMDQHQNNWQLVYETMSRLSKELAAAHQ